MESATISRRPGHGRRPRRRWTSRPLAKVAFALLCVGVAIGFFVFPTYPNYDSYYSLLWGREIVHGVMPEFEGFRVADRAPAGDRAGAVLSLFGARATGCGSR
jgi:hypothetical protein